MSEDVAGMTTRQVAYDAMLAVKEARDIDDTDYALADAIHDALAALSSPETTPAGVLDEAWAAAEKALPEGAIIDSLVRSFVAAPGGWTARVWMRVPLTHGPLMQDQFVSAFGLTPAAALHALAAALGRSGSGGGRG